MTGCWLYRGSLDRGGYGRTYSGGRNVYVHRAAYEVLVGPIPAGRELDHLCRNRACYNPAHLEPVTRAENIRRSEVGRTNRSKTHCPAGHPYDEENTTMLRSGGRGCRACGRARFHARKVGTK